MIRLARLVLVGAAVLVLAPAAASAQVHVNVGGGPTFVASDLGDHFSTGWGPAIGVTFDVSPLIGARSARLPPVRYQDEAPFFGATALTQPPDAPVGLQPRGELCDGWDRRSPYIVAGPV
jgi:hypothetical protein